MRAPNLRGVFGGPVPLDDGSVVTADERYVRDSILMPKSQVVASYRPIMPSFKNVLDEEELLALVAWIQSVGSEERRR